MASKWLFSAISVCLCTFSASAQVVTKVFNLASSHRELLDGTIDPVLCPNPPDNCHAKPSAGHDTGYTGVFKEGSYVGKNASGATVEFMNWRMVLPAGYNPTGPTKYPMIVMLHGAGEGGRKWNGQFDYQPNNVNYDNNGRNIIHGGAEHRDAVARNPSLSNSFPGIVIWPQVGYNGAWDGGWDNGNISDNVRMAANIIEYMIMERNVDPDRVVMHGLSNGAQGVWDLAAKRPDLFASILPMSGVGTNLSAMVNTLVTTPIWIFQGGTDTNPNPSASNDWTNAFNAAGGSMTRTLYPTLGHGTWQTAYQEANFYPYIKSKNKKDIYVFGGSASVCPGGTLQLGTSANHLAYQWAKDGVDIPGATTRYYGATTGGVYTVRWQRRWDNSWGTSNPLTVTSSASSPYVPVLTNTGSTFIPVNQTNGAALPGVKNFVYLKAPTGFTSYQWYKNGNLVATTASNERLVSQDAGVAGDAGVYRVKVASGCVSDFSNPITLTWFSPQPTSPVPTATSTSVVSSTSLNVTWPDYATEVSYELWRYRHSSTYGEQPWSQIATLAANTTSYVDTGLRP
jgi:predicted esterase